MAAMANAPSTESSSTQPTADPKEMAKNALAAVAKGMGLTTRVTAAGVLQVILAETTSFKQLETYHDAVKRTAKRAGVTIEDSLGSQGAELVVATRIGAKRPRPDDVPAPNEQKLRDLIEKIGTTVERVRKSASKDTVDADELETARGVLERCVARLTGTGGPDDRAVQSYGVYQRKLADTDPRPRIVVAMRLNAGVAIKLSEFKSCLGACWTDGAITTADSVFGVESVELPLTAEGKASRYFGNFSVLVVTSVPIASQTAAP
jgi:hypothetical protein